MSINSMSQNPQGYEGIHNSFSRSAPLQSSGVPSSSSGNPADGPSSGGSIFSRFGNYLKDGFHYDCSLGRKLIGGEESSWLRKGVGALGAVVLVSGGFVSRITGVAALVSMAASAISSFTRWVTGKVIDMVIDVAMQRMREKNISREAMDMVLSQMQEMAEGEESSNPPPQSMPLALLPNAPSATPDERRSSPDEVVSRSEAVSSSVALVVINHDFADAQSAVQRDDINPPVADVEMMRRNLARVMVDILQGRGMVTASSLINTPENRSAIDHLTTQTLQRQFANPVNIQLATNYSLEVTENILASPEFRQQTTDYSLEITENILANPEFQQQTADAALSVYGNLTNRIRERVRPYAGVGASVFKTAAATALFACVAPSAGEALVCGMITSGTATIFYSAASNRVSSWLGDFMYPMPEL